MKQAELLELIAGKRQGQVVAGLLQNFSQVEAALNAMETATGSAAIEFEKYMQGLEYKSERLSAIFTSIWLQGISSDTFKNIIDAVTVLTIGVEKLTRTFGLLPSVLAAVSAGMMLASTKFRTFIGLTKIGVASDMLTLWLVGLAQKFNLFTVSVRTATVATRIFQATATFGASIALGLIFDKLISATASYADTLAMTTDQQIEAITTTGGLVDEVDRLVKKLEEGNLSQQEQLDIQKRIAQLLPNATTGYTDQNEALAENIDLIIALNDAKRDELELRALDVIDSIGGEEKKNKLLEKNIQLQEEYNRLTQEWQTINKNGFFVIDDMGIKIDLTQEKLDELTSAMKNNRDEYVKNRQDAEAITRALEILAPILGLTSDEVEKVTDELLEQSKSIQDLDSSLASLLSTHKDTISTLKDFYSALKDVRDGKSINIDTIQKLIEADKDFINVVEVENGVLKISQQALEDLIKTKEEEALVTERAEVAKAKAVASNISARLQLYGVELDAIKTRSDARNAAAKLAGADYSETAHYESILDPIGVAQERLTKLQALLGTIKNEGLGDLKSSTSSTKTPYQALIDEYLALNNEIIKTNNLLAINSQSQALANDKQKIELLKEQNQLYAQQQKNLHNLANAYRSELKTLESQLSQQGFTFEGEGGNRMITNLDNIGGKTKEIEELFNRYIALQKQEIPKLGIEWRSLAINISKTTREIEGLLITGIFKPIEEELKSFSNELEILDFKLNMLSDSDFDGRMELTAQKMAVAQQQASYLNAEIQRLKEQGFDGTAESIAEYNSRLSDLESQYRATLLSMRSFERDIVRQRESLANDIIRIIQDSYRKELKLKVNSLREQLNAEERAHKRRIELLDEQLSKYEEIIKAQLQAIDRQEDESQFEKELAKEQARREEILREIRIFSMDDSLEGRNKVSELNRQLSEQDIKIEEMQHKRTIDLRKQNLNDQLNAYKKDIDAKKKVENDKIAILKDNIETEIKMVEWKYDKLINDTEKYENMRKDIIEGNLTEVQSLMNGFLDGFKNYNEETIKEIGASWQELQNLIYRIQSASNSMNSPSFNAPQNPPPPPQNPVRNIDYGNSGIGTHEQKSENERRLIEESGYVQSEIQRTNQIIQNRKDAGMDTSIQEQYLQRLLQMPQFHTGGIVGDKPKNKITELMDKMFNTSPNETVIKSLIGELQVPPQNMQKFAIPNLQRMMGIVQPNSPGGLVIDKLLTINGNVDAKVMPKLEDLVDRAVIKISELQKKNLNKSGIYRQV